MQSLLYYLVVSLTIGADRLDSLHSDDGSERSFIEVFARLFRAFTIVCWMLGVLGCNCKTITFTVR